jgi:pimeloyl-ACP methyl ester carboxylesterase
VVDVVRQMARDTGPATFARQTRAIMTRPDSRPTLAHITCPTVLVWGRQDGMATQAQQMELLNGIAGAWLETLEDTGHFTTLERPRETTQALRALLARVGR